jgi:hypothetical protein
MRDLTQPLHPALDDLRAEQLARWQDGERVLIEDLLSVNIDDEALLDLLYGEVLLREEFGDRPALADYQRRFPRLAEPLRRQFELHQALESLPGTEHGSLDSDAGDSTQHDHRRRETPGVTPCSIGEYEILEEIGRGGMGIVYKARHTLLPDRIVALKVIRAGSDDADLKQRCTTEAAAVAQLDHPNIVRLYEVTTAVVNGEKSPIVVLEYVAGETLARAIGGTPLPPQEAARLLQPLADAVAHAHSRGVLHRDLKPANVLLAACGVADAKPQAALAKITDFGLAKRLDVDSGQTRSGAILGTPSYMPPEQARGETHRIAPTADVYALGAILYEMLTGRPPFKADSVLHTLQQVTTIEPVSPRSLVPGVPRDLETICLKCLHKEPDRRYPSARALDEDLQRYLEGKPIMARPAGMMERALKWIRRRPAAAGLLAVSGLALLGLVAVWVYFTIQLQDEKAEALRLTVQLQQEKAEALRQKADAITQRDEAKKQKTIADNESKKAKEQSARAAHLLAVAAASVDQIAWAARGGKTDELETRNTGLVLFKLACNYARTSATLRQDRELLPQDQDKLADQFASSAVRLLYCAQKVGFFDRSTNRKDLETNADLSCLRQRPDFRAFMAGL